MLFDLIMGGDLRSIILGLVLGLPAVVICLTIHEAAHGFTAYLMGDKTAKTSGRLTLDPMAHIDPLGFMCMMLVGFGWARPVPVNISQFKNRRLGMGLVAAAGPVSNMILGFIAYVISITLQIKLYPISGFTEALVLFFTYIASMSVGLGVFNLLPVHPLDGSRILDAILPFKMQIKYQNFMNRYGSVVLLVVIAFLWIGGLSFLVVGARQLILNLALNFVGLLV